MSKTQTPRSVEQSLDELAQSPTKRPAGMVDWMHFGFALRYPGAMDYVEGEEELRYLEENVEVLDEKYRARLQPLLEARAWAAGTLLLRRLPGLFWPKWSTAARGRYLAGLSHHMCHEIPDEVVFDAASEILQRLPSVVLDAESAAEIGAKAIHTDRLDVLNAILIHLGLPEGPVLRFNGYRDQKRFERQLEKHSTRLLDVLFEAAVRCYHPEAMRLLLESGANPNIPCWNLERSYNDWWSALSYAIKRSCEFGTLGRVQQVTDLLLQHGAEARGLECEGWNNPLMTAMRGGRWEVVDRLLAHGAKFEGGRPYKPEDFRKQERFIPAGHPLIGYREEALDWVKVSLAPLVPLANFWEVPLFYKGNGQGGLSSTFLHCVMSDEKFPLLKKYQELGLPTTLTPTLMADLVDGGCYLALSHLLRGNPNLPRVMFRIRRHKPDFGISMRQLWLCQPEPDSSNLLSHFDPHGQEPLSLPDGSRVYALLDCVAPPDHEHGPVTEGCLWLEKITAEFRRRRDRIVTRKIRRVWRMESVPKNKHQIEAMIPLVKERNGKFFWLGINMDALSCGQEMPAEWKPVVKAWQEGEAREYILEKFIELGRAQRKANIEYPKPVLDEDKRKPDPREFWLF